MASETSQMHDRLVELQSNIESITTDFADLCVDHESKENEIDDLKKQLEDQKKENERLKEEIELQKDEIYKLQCPIMMQDMIDYLKKKIQELEEENEKYKLRNDRLFHENHDLDCLRGLDYCKIQKLEKETQDQKQKIEKLAGIISNLQDSNGIYSDKIDDLKTNLRKMMQHAATYYKRYKRATNQAWTEEEDKFYFNLTN